MPPSSSVPGFRSYRADTFKVLSIDLPDQHILGHVRSVERLVHLHTIMDRLAS